MINILIVDPESSSRDDLHKKVSLIFPRSSVVSFCNPLEALKYSFANKFDILFTDLRLHPIDGYELIKTLQQKQSFRSYVVSGSRDKPDNLDWMFVSGYYAKPLTLEELEAIARAESLQSPEGDWGSSHPEEPADYLKSAATATTEKTERDVLSARTVIKKLLHH